MVCSRYLIDCCWHFVQTFSVISVIKGKKKLSKKEKAKLEAEQAETLRVEMEKERLKKLEEDRERKMRERRDAKKKQEQEAVENKLRRVQLRNSSHVLKSNFLSIASTLMLIFTLLFFSICLNEKNQKRKSSVCWRRRNWRLNGAAICDVMAYRMPTIRVTCENIFICGLMMFKK